MSVSTKFAALFESMGINVRRVTQIGSFVHIDSFKKYENKIVDAMTKAGFVVAMVKDGVHLDGFDGYRIVFKLA